MEFIVKPQKPGMSKQQFCGASFLIPYYLSYLAHGVINKASSFAPVVKCQTFTCFILTDEGWSSHAGIWELEIFMQVVQSWQQEKNNTSKSELKLKIKTQFHKTCWLQHGNDGRSQYCILVTVPKEVVLRLGYKNFICGLFMAMKHN
jgi:hypothetical protein